MWYVCERESECFVGVSMAVYTKRTLSLLHLANHTIDGGHPLELLHLIVSNKSERRRFIVAQLQRDLEAWAYMVSTGDEVTKGGRYRRA